MVDTHTVANLAKISTGRRGKHYSIDDDQLRFHIGRGLCQLQVAAPLTTEVFRKVHDHALVGAAEWKRQLKKSLGSFGGPQYEREQRTRCMPAQVPSS